MVRTQVQLSERQHGLLREEAFRRGTSVASVLRDLVDQALDPPKADPRDDPAAWAWLGFARDSAGDVAENHDAYLAGERE